VLYEINKQINKQDTDSELLAENHNFYTACLNYRKDLSQLAEVNSYKPTDLAGWGT